MTAFFNTGLSQQQFLQQYWQKKPLLIRQAFADFKSPISADELAGLACETDIESRLIEERGEHGPWQLRHGPFDEAVFAGLPASNWTLLVQDVDKHVPELSALLQAFNFIPDWRRDDLMVSYAPVNGSVGPHTDGYDVFLLQAMGTRRWQISDEPVTEARFVDGLDLKILSEFKADSSWDLSPGDMLYLPPHYAHHGVALDACITFSIGFRAPTQSELLDAFLHTLTEQDGGQQRYADPDLQVTENDKQIDAAALQRFRQLLVDCISQSDDFLIASVGRLLTETKPGLELLADERCSDNCSGEEIVRRFAEGDKLLRNHFLRFAWAETDAGVTWFVAGEAYILDKQAKLLMPMLSSATQLTAAEWQVFRQHPQGIELLQQLIAAGGWYWSRDAD
jgi:50S ribosomal protein L16 3-hydroxylase